MPWNSTSPIGNISVKANRATMQQNVTYIETTMGNSAVGTNTTSTRDHFWDVGSDEDGRHRFIQSPAFTVGGLPTDPVIGTGMDAVSYPKLKSASEATAQQDVQPFFRNVTGVMQGMFMRACVVFSADGTIAYSHNVASVFPLLTGVYIIQFATPLPSENYLVTAGCVRTGSSNNSTAVINVAASTNGSLSQVKSTTALVICAKTIGDTGINPLQSWVACYGG